MKHYILYFLITFAGVICLNSCESDDPDKKHSIFDEQVERNSFDKWLDENYVKPYNIRVAYRIEDIETDFDYNVIPADLEKSKQMAICLKHLWLEAYTEVASEGVHFIRAYAPKLFHYIGSSEHNPEDGTIRLGVAEGGKKITITTVNALVPKDIVNQYYFNTIHHEFGHILHQTKNYPTEFQTISASDYGPLTWQNRTDAQAAKLGFVSNYAGKLPDEDFVEVLARYLTRDEATWNAMLVTAEAAGSAKILQKLDIVKTYMKTTWGIDLDRLKQVVQRRANEIQYMDFDNLDF
jgi:substrate import-associated zinc metallohydrolase lipoprotein